MKEHSRRALHSATVCCLVLCAMALSSVGALAASCRYVKFATLPVSLKSASPTIEGSVNGHAMTVLIDSGSSETTLTRGIAERAGLALAHSNVVSYGVGGESQQYHALVDEVSFGPVRWKRARLPVVWSVTDKSRIDALLGANFLFQNDVEMALAEGQIRFYKPENCGDAFLAYWNADAQVVPMRTLAPDDPRQVIDIEVNGQAVRALIDSGADRSAISVSAAARAGVRVDTGKVVARGKTSGVGAHEVDTWIATFDRIRIGDEAIENTELEVTDLWGAARVDSNTRAVAELTAQQPEVLLGADFLRSHRVLFAMSQRRFYFSHTGGPVFATRR
jgi:predicted aspartyl protease